MNPADEPADSVSFCELCPRQQRLCDVLSMINTEAHTWLDFSTKASIHPAQSLQCESLFPSLPSRLQDIQ